MSMDAASLAQRWLLAQTSEEKSVSQTDTDALLKLANDPESRCIIVESLRSSPAAEEIFWQSCMGKLLDQDDAAHDPSRSITIDRLRDFACSMMALKANSSCFRGLLTYVNKRYQFTLTVSAISHPLLGAGDLLHLLGQIVNVATQPKREGPRSFLANRVADEEDDKEKEEQPLIVQVQSLGFSLLYQLGLAAAADGSSALGALKAAAEAEGVTRANIDDVFPAVPARAVLEEAATKLLAGVSGDTTSPVGDENRRCCLSGQDYPPWEMIGVSASNATMSEPQLVRAALEQRMGYWIPLVMSESSYRRALHLTDPLRWPARPFCIGIAVIPLIDNELQPMCERGSGSRRAGASTSSSGSGKGRRGSKASARLSTEGTQHGSRGAGHDSAGGSAGILESASVQASGAAGGAGGKSNGTIDRSMLIMAPSNIYSSSYKHDFPSGKFRPAPQVQKAGVVRAVGLFGRAGASSVDVVRAITLALIRQQSQGLLFYHKAYLNNGRASPHGQKEQEQEQERAERDWWYKHMEEEVLHLLSANSSKKYMRDLHRAAQVLDKIITHSV
jgi:hypothetical protein